MLPHTYNPLLVVCSLFVAVLAAYAAFDMAGRIASAKGRMTLWWLLGGACAMGLGIWSTHFVGMQAFTLPIPLGYDPLITIASLFIAIAVSAFALFLVCQDALPIPRLIVGAVMMGLAIAGMHYTGMAGMRMRPAIEYDPALAVLSVILAIVASGAALSLAFRLRGRTSMMLFRRSSASLVIGVAFVSIHFAGMAAARFPMGSVCGAAHNGANHGWLALVTMVVALAVIAIALTISVFDLRMEARTAALATSLAAANNKLAHLALHDSLTELPNRVLLENRLEELVRSAKHAGDQFTLMFMDLDGFKAVNDAFGHRVGDQLLIDVATRAGGSHVWSFSKEDAQRLSHRLRLRADLASASAARQFELYYQPQMDLHTGRIYGAEALLRWNHPQLGLLTPADFLDVLLDSPAYEATGEWLIRGAFRQAAQWQATGRMPFKVAVNLSPTTIQNCDLAALVSEGAEAFGVCASVLDIEVTETAVMSDFAAASRALSAVRRLGVTVSLDDFGTGYSSLAYLMRLPVDRVKIDKSFVQQLPAKETGRQARAMVEAMVALARALGMRTVAEGIETGTQLGLVKELGCDAAQGYFIGKPESAARIEPYAETRFGPVPVAGSPSQDARSGSY